VPISIRDLARETRQLEVTLSDDVTVTVTYKPNYSTMALEEELASLTGAASLNAKTLCGMITAWDIADEDERIVPITVEGIRDAGIPNRIVMMLIDAIVEDMRPKEKRQNGSSRS
jgi:alpha-L-arabinofuranosidase